MTVPRGTPIPSRKRKIKQKQKQKRGEKCEEPQQKRGVGVEYLLAAAVSVFLGWVVYHFG